MLGAVVVEEPVQMLPVIPAEVVDKMLTKQDQIFTMVAVEVAVLMAVLLPVVQVVVVLVVIEMVIHQEVLCMVQMD
tara:strand:+ start:275 stop:502 length:228 start_codon:yes stop_codon:yes gene_type:complete